jgi:hypothetical protein
MTVVLGAMAATACASVGSDPASNSSGTSSGSTGGNGSSGDVTGGGLGGGGGLLGGGAGQNSTSTNSDAGGDGGNTQVCTDAGCTCIRIASIGHEGIWGACGMNGDSTGAFETWLDTQSSATVDSYAAAKPTLTPSFLAQYNVIILQWLRDVPDAGGDGPLWQFTQDEVDALAAWVKACGGLISMSGYDGDGQETVPLNTLLSFTDFSYNQDGTYGSSYAGGSCWGGASGLTGWNTATPIGAHLTEIGISNGRSVSVDADAGYAPVVDCPCPGGNDCAVHEDIGAGHVFAFTDEWVTYTSQWLGTASCISSSSCTGNTPADDFQVPQFWYNALRYASEAAQCAFTINNPMVIPR